MEYYLPIVIFVIVLSLVMGNISKKRKDARMANEATQIKEGILSQEFLAIYDYEIRERAVFKKASVLANEQQNDFAAEVFLTIARGREIHANTCLKNLESANIKIKEASQLDASFDTFNQIIEHVSDTSYLDVYKQYLEEARKAQIKDGAKAIKYISNADQEHLKLALSVLQKLEAPKDPRIWLCPICGIVEVGNHSAYCIVCATPGFYFEEIGQNVPPPPLPGR